MDKEALIKKMEESVAALRLQLGKHDGSALSAAAEGAKSGFDALKARLENVKDNVMGSEKTQNALTKTKEQLEVLEKAIKSGDRKVSAKALEVMEKAIKELKGGDSGSK